MYIAINRPEVRNCVNIETGLQLVEALKQLDADPDVHVGILHGSGGNFCAGFDLKELSSFKGTEEARAVKKAPMGPSHMLVEKPLIAAIDGYAVAGGLELALFCDMRVVEETAFMGVYCRRFGVPLIDGGTVRLPALIGLSRAMDMILTGRGVGGKEALQFGLANKCVSHGTALGAATSLAQCIAKFPQECVKADKRSAYYSSFSAKSLQDALDYEYVNGKPVIESEAVDGAGRFVQEKIGRHGKFNLDTFEKMMNAAEPTNIP
ncbi:3-hydroxypropionyl-coenzyme A dehydratase [Halotydeus destructor]|nr:3-hydroxypropionyl-coenzyme A dehydratase [Halotydeus destructor]